MSDDEWISPAQASEVMSKKAGYIVTRDDIKQMRRRKKLTKIKKINNRISLYNLQEILEAKPPKKYHPQPIPEENNPHDEISQNKNNNDTIVPFETNVQEEEHLNDIASSDE